MIGPGLGVERKDFLEATQPLPLATLSTWEAGRKWKGVRKEEEDEKREEEKGHHMPCDLNCPL